MKYLFQQRYCNSKQIAFSYQHCHEESEVRGHVFVLLEGVSKGVSCPVLQSSLTFELFSVMVHSGSAAGGHYYACIKSFSDGQWYSFNDQHVSKVRPQPSRIVCASQMTFHRIYATSTDLCFYHRLSRFGQKAHGVLTS